MWLRWCHGRPCGSHNLQSEPGTPRDQEKVKNPWKAAQHNVSMCRIFYPARLFVFPSNSLPWWMLYFIIIMFQGLFYYFIMLGFTKCHIGGCHIVERVFWYTSLVRPCSNPTIYLWLRLKLYLIFNKDLDLVPGTGLGLAHRTGSLWGFSKSARELRRSRVSVLKAMSHKTVQPV